MITTLETEIVLCKRCKWWTTDIPKGISAHRECLNPNLKSDGLNDLSSAGVDDGYGQIETGPEFGCIHGERKF